MRKIVRDAKQAIDQTALLSKKGDNDAGQSLAFLTKLAQKIRTYSFITYNL